MIMKAVVRADAFRTPALVGTEPSIRDPADRDQARKGSSKQLAVIREMLLNMENLTIAGQRYAMAKIVTFLENRVSPGSATVSGRNRFMLAHLVHQLSCEAQRSFPDVACFDGHVQSLLALLAEIVD
jgi:hypothetical protein